MNKPTAYAHGEFSAKLELALGFRKIGQGDRAAGQRHVFRALEQCPALVGEIERLIPDWVTNQTWASPLDLTHTILDALPNEIAKAGHLRHRVVSHAHVAEAFRAYSAGQGVSVASHVLRAARHKPSILKNRGVLSISAKSLLNRRHRERRSGAIAEADGENIPDSIKSEIESKLGCALEQVERVTMTKRRIYLIRAGDQEYVLHIFDGAKDVLERKLALAERVRAAGVPVPAPVACSLSLTTSARDCNWLLEERMRGSGFYPSELSWAMQLSVVADLGRYLRQLHNLRVTGFGPILSTQLDAPDQTFAAWLSGKQQAIAEACFVGDVPEIALPALDTAYHLLHETYVGSPVLCHCELSVNNILVSEGHVSALIDWESATGTDPAYDVGIFFATTGSYWHPERDQEMLAAFLEAYGPDDPGNFRQRVIAHRLLFIAGGITWLKQYGDEVHGKLKSILSTPLNDS